MPGHANTEPADAMKLLNRSGWSVGDAGLRRTAAHWFGWSRGRNGENVIRAEGATQTEAWRRALEQAR